ncbi:hypothetical protein CAP36_05485 [Chitinophagaceae bacterium IBVUCB2]|nr:hypothetical protein CAP36_05485 [Chitinophagaceae bacterium IBVUCB2]
MAVAGITTDAKKQMLIGTLYPLNKYLSSKICNYYCMRCIFPIKFFSSCMESSDASRPTRDIPP